MSEPRSSQSVFRLGENCYAVARAGRAAFVVDGAQYFEAFRRAAENARASIIILAWDFDSRTRLEVGADGERSTPIGDFLNGLARRRRELHVRVLDWDYPMVFGTDREVSPLYGLSWKPHRRVHFRYDDTHPLAGSHHQKIVVIDDRLAFVGGLDLTSRRWDTPEHRANDPRRTSGGETYPPFHDLMVALDGEAAAVVAEVARKRWEAATGEALSPVSVALDPWPAALKPDVTDVDVGIACTAPENGDDDGVRDVEQLYLDMIARAKRTLYIENQYFTSHTIGRALAERLKQADGPEVVLVTRLLSHGWLEEMTMHVLRTRLIRDLRKVDRYGRFHVYYPHVDGLAEGTCVDMHSKMMAVDDEWLRIGSANLSNRSMGLDTECDAVLEAGGQARVRAAITDFRDRLIAEHAGSSLDEVRRELERSGTLATAIERLGSESRRLKPLEDLPEWPESVVEAIRITDPERPVSLDSLVEQFASDEEEAAAPRKLARKFVAFAALVVAFALAWRFTPLAHMVTADKVLGWVEAFSDYWWAPLAIVLSYTPASLIMVPRPLITVASVVAYNPWAAFFFSLAGNVLAASVAYAAGRRFGRNTVRRIAGKRLNRVCALLKRRGLLAVTAIRLVPVAPFVVESVVAGAIRIRFLDFALGTLIGHLPGTLATTIFGGQIETALRDPSRINYWLVGGVVLVLAVGAVAVRKWFARMEAELPPSDEPRRPGAGSPARTLA